MEGVWLATFEFGGPCFDSLGFGAEVSASSTYFWRLDLPRTYGVDDLPIILQDRSIEPDGSIGYDNNDLNALEIAYGARGNTVVVNGAIWEITSVGMAHPFHVHGALFRILSIEGAPPPAHLTGWKDTVQPDSTPSCITATSLNMRMPD